MEKNGKTDNKKLRNEPSSDESACHDDENILLYFTKFHFTKSLNKKYKTNYQLRFDQSDCHKI